MKGASKFSAWPSQEKVKKKQKESTIKTAALALTPDSHARAKHYSFSHFATFVPLREELVRPLSHGF